MDAFFASIEQSVNPYLKGKPLVVGARANKMHTVVCAASYEAKALGIESGMPTSEAFRICPELNFVVADQDKYLWTSEHIFGLLKGLGFPIRYASIDEFQMDIGNLVDPTGLARGIQHQIQQLFKITASVGIAKNWLLAKLASKINKPNGLVILTEENLKDILCTIPLNKLCGTAGKRGDFLLSEGLRSCLDLYQMPLSWLKLKLGKVGQELYFNLHANEHFQEAEEQNPKSIGHSYTFARIVQNRYFIQAWLRLLSEMVGRRLRALNLEARSQSLILWGPEIGNFSCQKTFSQATNDSFEIYRRAVKIMLQKKPRLSGVRGLGVTCFGLVKSNYYYSLFYELRKREALTRTIDKINSTFGENTIYPAIYCLISKNNY